MQIVYRADCATAHLRGRISPDTIERVRRVLSYTVRTKRWDGRRVSFFDDRMFLLADDLSFPAGLVRRVVQCLAFSSAPEIVDERPAPPWGDTLPDIPNLYSAETKSESIVLRDHDQKAALNIFFANPRGIIEHPTATGKTEEAAALLKIMRRYGGQCLFLQDRKGLMHDTAARLSISLQERVGKIGDSHRDVRARVIVCTQQALWARIGVYARELFPNVTCVVVDECHDISDNIGHKLLRLIHAPVRLGLSATIKESPKRMVVESYLGPVLHSRSALDAIESGDIARPDCHMLRVGGVFDDSLEPDAAYMRGVILNKDRNGKFADVMMEYRRREWPSLMLCSRIQHGELLQEACIARGLDIPFIHGETPEDEIRRVIADLQSGRLASFIASRIFDKGRNVPSIRGMALAGGLRSSLLQVQRAGRGLRKKEDNRVAIVDAKDFGQKTLLNQSEDRETTMRVKYGHVTLISTAGEIAQ